MVNNSEILNVYNNIIWGNSAHDGDDIYLSGFGASKKLMNNTVHDVAGVFELALHNIDAAPVFFNPTSDDYHVRLGSLSIDAGDPAAPNLPSTDRDGLPRSAGLRVDMGCYEFDNTGGHPADLDDNFVISQAEYDNYAAAWKNDLGWSRGPQPIDADYVTRAGFILNNGGTYHNDGGAIPTNWKPGTGN